MLLLLALLGTLQGLTATARVRSGTVTVGDGVEVTLTVRAVAAGVAMVSDPPLAGVILLGRQEVSEAAFGGGNVPQRTTTVTFELRAIAAGRASVGPWRVEQGGEVVEVQAVTFDVVPSPTGATAALSEIAERLLARARPPARGDEVAITVIPSGQVVRVGEQLDLVVAAWFPRELRGRLRRPPTIVTAAPQAVWQYPQGVAPGVAASRRVNDTWMDVYATHLVLFPLKPGRLELPPQRLEYAVPVTSSFFSREERYAVASQPVALTVQATPEGGRPANDVGAVGGDLALEVEIAPAAVKVGEPQEVVVTLSGQGNVALWPPPRVEWPAAFRVYPSEPKVTLAPIAGRVAGSKRFSWLLVPDSAGAFGFPGIEYPYFDLGRGAYRVAVAAPRAVAAAPSGALGPARAAPLLSHRRSPGWAMWLTGGWGAWHLAIAAGLGPLVLVVARLRWRRRAPAVAHVRSVERLEGEFGRVLEARVGRAAHAERVRLVAALRAAGVEGTLAEHAGRLRERLRAARYAPRRAGDAVELATELETVIGGLTGEGEGRARRLALERSLLGVALVSVAAGAVAQSPEALYDLGALRPAADSFAERAGREPRVAAHWYNLGATVYRAGADGRAVAAWTAAARLTPRDRAVQRARGYLPPADPVTGDLLWAAPITPREAWLLSLALWTAGWITVALRARRAVPVALFGTAVLLGAAGVEIGRRYARPVAVVTTASPLREAPYGSAKASGTLAVGAAVVVVAREPGWILAARPDGARGWLAATEAVSVPRVL